LSAPWTALSEREQHMETNLTNRVRNLRFRRISKLTPIFEAISNALHAIALGESEPGRIQVEIIRDKRQGHFELPEAEFPVRDIIVTDSGVGFTQENYEAFGVLDTDIKRKYGSKGIGRLFWLKVFDRVEVESIFTDGKQLMKRSFAFVLPDGVIEHRCTNAASSDRPGTRVALLGVKDPFRRAYRVDAGSFREAILHHFMSFFVTQFVPVIEIKDGATNVEINKESLPEVESETFEAKGWKFRIIHMRLSEESASSHAVHFCAADRVVKSRSVADLLGNFTRRALRDAGQEYFYAGYVMSDELTERVAAERDDFLIEDTVEDLLFEQSLSWQEIEQEVAPRVSAALSKPLEELRKARDERVDEVFSEQIPELSYLRRVEPQMFSNMALDASEKEIALNANRLHFEKRRNVVEKLNHTLDSMDVEGLSDFETFRTKFADEIIELSEVGQADLASYMFYRQKVLSILLKAVQLKSDGSFEKERVVHSLLFPRFQDSEGASIYDGHNLWLLDEALTFESYIASDVPLKDHKVLVSNSDEKPDIVAYGLNFGINVATQPFDHITIIELKRPGVKLGRRNPIEQIYDYIDDIRAGKVRDVDGLEVKVTASTRFFGIVLCDAINDVVEKAAQREKLLREADGLGWHGSNAAYNLYLRVVSFRAVYEHGFRRHQKFFETMGLGRR
jgi:hypothetical protein